VGSVVIPAGLLIATIGFAVGTVIVVSVHSKRASHRRTLSCVWHIAGMIALGVAAAVPAAGAGIRHYCVDGAGAQCGLGGALGTGPLAFGIAALVYAAGYAIWDAE
jgi:hypothetical protein